MARRYGALLDGYVLDEQDAAEAEGVAARCVVARSLMTSLEDKVALARVALDLADALRG